MIDKKLKKIVIDSEKFYYKVVETTDGAFIHTYTNFYKTNDKFKLVRKYGIIGKLFKEHDNKVIFRLNIDVESHKYSKDEVRKLIEYELRLLSRKEEINKGEIL